MVAIRYAEFRGIMFIWKNATFVVDLSVPTRSITPADTFPAIGGRVGKKPVGRNRMSRAVAFFAALLASVIVAIPAGAAEFGTRDEATAMVRRVQQKFRKEGPDATFRPS